MTIETTELARSFRYNSVDLPDPGAQYTPDQVRDFYSATYPEINSAAIEGPEEKDGKLVYTFRKAVGTKGALPTREELLLRLGNSAQAGNREDVLACVHTFEAIVRSEIPEQGMVSHGHVEKVEVGILDRMTFYIRLEKNACDEIIAVRAPKKFGQHFQPGTSVRMEMHNLEPK